MHLHPSTFQALIPLPQQLDTLFSFPTNGWDTRASHVREKVGHKSMKRAEKEVKEGESTKKAKKDVFAEIPEKEQRQIRQAVFATLGESAQPIILQVMGMDDPGQNDYELAYWPASQEIGERLVKTLVLLRQQDREKHCSLIDLLTYEEDEEIEGFELYLGTVKYVSELGKVKYLSYWDAEENEDRELFGSCPRSSLYTFLYYEQCFV